MFVSQSDYHKYFTKPSRGRKSDVPWDDIGEHNNDWYWFVKDSDRTKNQIDGDKGKLIGYLFAGLIIGRVYEKLRHTKKMIFKRFK